MVTAFRSCSTHAHVLKKLWVVDGAMTQSFLRQPLGCRKIDDPEVFIRHPHIPQTNEGKHNLPRCRIFPTIPPFNSNKFTQSDHRYETEQGTFNVAPIYSEKSRVQGIGAHCIYKNTRGCSECGISLLTNTPGCTVEDFWLSPK